MHTTAKVIKIAVAVAAAVVLVMLLLWKSADNKALLPDRAPPNVDENAIVDDNQSDKMDAPPGGGASSFNYSKKVTIDLASGTASLHFENSGKSLYDAAIFLVIQDTIVLQSDLLPPGSLIKTLPLPDTGVPLQTGGYDGELWIQFYDENGDAISVNSKLQGIAIEVK